MGQPQGAMRKAIREILAEGPLPMIYIRRRLALRMKVGGLNVVTTTIFNMRVAGEVYAVGTVTRVNHAEFPDARRGSNILALLPAGMSLPVVVRLKVDRGSLTPPPYRTGFRWGGVPF